MLFWVISDLLRDYMLCSQNNFKIGIVPILFHFSTIANCGMIGAQSLKNNFVILFRLIVINYFYGAFHNFYFEQARNASRIWVMKTSLWVRIPKFVRFKYDMISSNQLWFLMKHITTSSYAFNRTDLSFTITRNDKGFSL